MGVPNNLEDEKIEEKVIEILEKIEVNVSTQDIEACHWVKKSENNFKKLLFVSLIENMQRKLFSLKKD